jgi:hypothetical protein
MQTAKPPEILFAEVLRNGLVIAFNDGTCAIYSADLLRQMMPDALPLTEQFRNLH